MAKRNFKNYQFVDQEMKCQEDCCYTVPVDLLGVSIDIGGNHMLSLSDGRFFTDPTFEELDKLAVELYSGFPWVGLEDIADSYVNDEKGIKTWKGKAEGILHFRNTLEIMSKGFEKPLYQCNKQGTSNRCNSCRYESSENRKGLKFKCINCGFENHADINAAVNINDDCKILHLLANGYLPSGRKRAGPFVEPGKVKQKCDHVDYDGNSDCDLEAVVKGKCDKHYQAEKNSAICHVEDCAKLVYSNRKCREHHVEEMGKLLGPCVKCGNPAFIAKYRLCGSCHYRLRRDGQLPPKIEGCSIDGCTAQHYGLGLCQKHYCEFRKNDPSRPRCQEPGCSNTATYRDYCDTHYMRKRRNGETKTKIKCSYPGCQNNHYRFGYCDGHLYNAQTYGIGEDGLPDDIIQPVILKESF